MSKKTQKKGISVWLVTWEAVSSDEPDKIAAILNSRWSANRVKDYVEFIYALSMYSLSEQIGYANNRRFNPYPAKFHVIGGVQYQSQIICGHNPSLYARKVDNLTVTVEQEVKENISWTERPNPTQ